jgi:hypothetical protein
MKNGKANAEPATPRRHGEEKEAVLSSFGLLVHWPEAMSSIAKNVMETRNNDGETNGWHLLSGWYSTYPRTFSPTLPG